MKDQLKVFLILLLAVSSTKTMSMRRQLGNLATTPAAHPAAAGAWRPTDQQAKEVAVAHEDQPALADSRRTKSPDKREEGGGSAASADVVPTVALDSLSTPQQRATEEVKRLKSWGIDTYNARSWGDAGILGTKYTPERTLGRISEATSAEKEAAKELTAILQDGKELTAEVKENIKVRLVTGYRVYPAADVTGMFDRGLRHTVSELDNLRLPSVEQDSSAREGNFETMKTLIETANNEHLPLPSIKYGSASDRKDAETALVEEYKQVLTKFLAERKNAFTRLNRLKELMQLAKANEKITNPDARPVSPAPRNPKELERVLIGYGIMTQV